MNKGQEALYSLRYELNQHLEAYEGSRAEYNEKIRIIDMELDQLEIYKDFTIPNLQKALLTASKIIEGHQVSEKDLLHYDTISEQVKVVLKNE